MIAEDEAPDSGPRLPDGLGEPQWAAIITQPRAHFLTMHPRGPAWVMTACGLTLMNQMIYHPGDMPLCQTCLKRHTAPRRGVSPNIITWFLRPSAPMDRYRRV